MHTLAAVLSFLDNLGCLSANNGNLSVAVRTEACQAQPQSMIKLSAVFQPSIGAGTAWAEFCQWGKQLSTEVGIYVGEGMLSHQTELATATTWPGAE